MRAALFLLCLSLTGSSLFAAGEKDQIVTVSNGVNGAWLKPASGWDGRAVLFLHGFADDMNGAGDLTKQMAELLVSKGIASLRINFRGEGDRNRTDIESTFQTRLADTEAGYHFLIAQPGISTAHIGAVGWSLGTACAIEVGGEHPTWFSSIVVWSSLSGDLYKYMSASPTAQKAIKEGVASDTVPGWKTITTKREFYESFKGYDLDKSLSNYHGAFLTLRGSEDFLPHNDEELLKSAGGTMKQSVMIGGADHIFKVFTPELGLSKRALQITDGWLETTL